MAAKRVASVLGVAFLGTLGCAPHEPPAAAKNDVFALRYLEVHPEALVADSVHPVLAELQLGLLDLFDDEDDRRLLAIDPRRTVGARTEPLAQRLVEGTPKGDETPASPPISVDGSAEVRRYLEAYKSVLAKGAERAELVEPALRLFDALIVEARADAKSHLRR